MAEPFHGAKRRAQIVRDGIGERLELLVPLLELPGARPHPPLKPLLRLPHVGDHHVERARQAVTNPTTSRIAPMSVSRPRNWRAGAAMTVLGNSTSTTHGVSGTGRAA